MSHPIPLDLAVIVGELSSDPVSTALGSGSVLVRYQVTVRSAQRTESVPVSWLDPPRRTSGLAAGDTVVVLGTVRRRFYRAGGRTASATEVSASSVRKATPTSLASAHRRAATMLANALESAPSTHGPVGL